MTPHVAHLATDYLEGALDARSAMAFEAHVAVCPACGRVLAELRETVRVLGQLPPVPLSASSRDRLLRTFRAWRDER